MIFQSGTKKETATSDGDEPNNESKEEETVKETSVIKKTLGESLKEFENLEKQFETLEENFKVLKNAKPKPNKSV